jgi:hypothetical protein
MFTRYFQCECGNTLEDTKDIFPKCVCGKQMTYTHLKRCISHPESKIKGETVNICADGDFHPYYSPDLGIYVDSPKTLNDHLRKKGMVNLQESGEYREHEAAMREKVMQFPSMRGKI